MYAIKKQGTEYSLRCDEFDCNDVKSYQKPLPGGVSAFVDTKVIRRHGGCNVISNSVTGENFTAQTLFNNRTSYEFSCFMTVLWP
jgi:hypothetical protein